ncbi:hypothetical protein Ciccas_000060 [Cichlidogyrus casuarinus]|uniref:Uncharacterized protein n=1 Tax=Cichlidogyrus casuarinus TaxID=1844966 RepID=A0ABD2QQ52_9PLAT
MKNTIFSRLLETAFLINNVHNHSAIKAKFLRLNGDKAELKKHVETRWLSVQTCFDSDPMPRNGSANWKRTTKIHHSLAIAVKIVDPISIAIESVEGDCFKMHQLLPLMDDLKDNLQELRIGFTQLTTGQ